MVALGEAKVLWNKTNVLMSRKAAKASVPFSPSLCAFVGDSTTATVGRVSAELAGPARSFPSLLNFLTAFRRRRLPITSPLLSS